MIHVTESVLTEFLETCHRSARHELVRCSSGNLSWRLDGDRLLATASRSWMRELSAAEVSVCRIADGALLEGPKPTVEIGLHAAILRTRHDVHAVLHFQSPCATALACRTAVDETAYFVIPEIPFYIGPVAHVPYLPPGSASLADAVSDAMQTHDLVVMRNHGMVTVAADFDHAIQNAVFFELACEILLHGNTPPRPLPEAEAAALLAARARGGV